MLQQSEEADRHSRWQQTVWEKTGGTASLVKNS